MAGQLGGGISENPDQSGTDMLDGGKQSVKFLGLCTIGKHQNDILFADNPQVAMQSLGGIQKHSWRAGAGERGCDLVGNDARLADACDHDLAGRGKEQLHGSIEGGLQISQSPLEGGNLVAENYFSLGIMSHWGR